VELFSFFHLVDVLVAPLRKALRMGDLTQEEIGDIFGLVKQVQAVMEAVYQARSSTLSVQDGPDAGQTINVSALHIFLRGEFVD
jgi:diadenosine tetraphosphate (Ap4A) HIT family hydrolase